ncbi:TPA: type I 3-dehydroquinate dehydratase [Acinetobacter baumannii]|uniref:type I 3-dehydroquinate dehydratase n=1 Tax=Acinetobacter baumannii TaxID=470 RepID=UPI000C707D50|nr:type I 3-dehydroquinate dehydratase [Acinetobacter baumannii]KAA8950491.1 type I 3-dehydroquinate dehydratase [Acinetobacter baumannii]MCA4440714.1 type I 3-dehydroquinate dehydratase [Acinetobacter baumannii]MCG6610714.1 type I 3-dehydroquinate dehydratase [Acinetobacter baumannii]MCG9257980.1 type I 3-dehydroquinate dehydratase [Acinetobacter baumannii]MCG9261705.1 type I 3-dehydroquinate dehydratase [Acinetobacter baumannii]
MKTLLILSLLALPFFAAQANAEPVTLNAQTQPAATAVKTIVPITAKNKEQALAQAQVIANTADADLAEFRIDLLSFASDTKQVIALGHELKKILGNKPMIATIRTKNEGGQLEISDADYGKTYQAYLKNPFMDWLDVEMFRDQKVVSEIVQKAHQKKVLVVMSNHDFQKTPSQDEIEKRLLKQDQMGADVLKIAVMPKSKQDVFTLMNATLKVSQQTTKPLLTMSMGQLGTISRVATANMGGSYSFGMIGEASAPGQIDVTKLKQILQTVQPTNP